MEKVPARRVPAAYKLKGVRITGGAARRWGSGQSRVKGRAAISRRQARTTAGMSIEERERERGSITEQQSTANSNIIEHAMATIRAPSTTFLSAFLPVVRARLLPHQEQAVRRIPLLHQIQQLRAAASLLPAVLVPIPSLLEHIWDGILKAVPKKKTSHMKKRHRQMAGKALKDVTALNKCSACGRTKRAHVLCPYCVNSGWCRLRRV